MGSLLGENLDLVDGAEFEVPIKDLTPNPYQPRQPVPDGSLAELVDSIREHGLLQPIVVRAQDAGWEIVAGERRWRALRELNWKTAPVVVRDLSDEQMLLVALVENLQREALSPLEEARSYQQLADDFGLTQGEIAKKVGKDRSTISNALRLLALPVEVQALVHGGEISAGHARAILGLEGDASRRALAEDVVARGLSVRQTEGRVRRMRKAGDSKKRKPKPAEDAWSDPYLRRAQQALERALGTEVSVRLGRKSRGEIRVVFHDAEDLDRLLGLLAGRSASEL